MIEERTYYGHRDRAEQDRIKGQSIFYTAGKGYYIKRSLAKRSIDDFVGGGVFAIGVLLIILGLTELEPTKLGLYSDKMIYGIQFLVFWYILKQGGAK